VDFGGHNSVEDNKNMALQYMRAYSRFSKYCIEKSFVPNIQRLFSFKKNKSTKKE
jgi:hypothetical protein